MKKNILLLLTPLVLSLVFSSCFRDDTTLGDNKVSEITIGSYSDIINTEVKDELVFTPEVSQTIENSELTYEWAIGDYAGAAYPVGDTLIVISNEPVLRYEFNTLGDFTLRLKVSNEDIAEYKFFRLNVNSPYEEGIIVLSENEAGVADISFMKTLTPEEITEGKTPVFLTNVFSAINPDYQIKDAVDMETIGNKLVVASKENGRLYKMDYKTFDLISAHEAVIDFPGIVLAAIEPFDKIGAAVADENKNLLVDEDGKIYGYNAVTDIVFETNWYNGWNFEKTYTKRTKTVYSSGYVAIGNYQWGVDYDLSEIVYSNVVSRTYTSGTRFSDHDIVNVISNKATNLFTVSTEKADPTQIHVTQLRNSLYLIKDFDTYTDANLTLSRDSKMAITDTYNKIYYNSGNDIYLWNYVATHVLPTVPEFTLDAGLELISIDMSPNGEEVYLGVYDPAAPGLKGSVYVYNANDASLIKKYEGIADKPIRVFYKEK